MPHHNPKIQKMEQETLEHIKQHGKGHKNGRLDRAVVKATGEKILANLRVAVVAGQPTLTEAIDHTEASLDVILDAIEAAS